jgi:ABC-type bacteriocin/lantibiotic exporter with double-glycine peptidase domain
MKIIEHLVYKFFQEEYVSTGIIIALNLIKVILKINGLSFITANIIRGIEQKNYKSTYEYFNYFIGISFLFIFFYAITNFLQNGLLVKMTQWVKREVLKIIFMTNNENFSDVNFIEFITPITRISASSYIIFSTILLWLLPTFSFLFIIAIYFLYKNINLGLFFVIANILICSYIYYFWDSLLEKKTDQEKIINENEKYIINLLNNIDKVIYRGQTINEMNTYKDKTDKCINVTNSFFKTINIHSLLLNIFIHIAIFICIGYMIYLCIQKKMDATIFITFFTIILFYRDTMVDVLHEIPTILEFTGRMVYIINEFKTMLGDNEEVTDLKIYDNISLNFDSIRFENISYLYPGTDKYIFKNTNLTMDTHDKIIGITGLSGNGKSTLAKLLIKMYKPKDGNIYIDDVNIEDIDPQYIRENITYVNQNSKLFDKVVVDNMLYGCNDVDKCKSHLAEIMKYPKIVKLYRDVDLYSKKTGSLGERISGGQRQIVNVINGLINPTQILILDEPTNALDIELKRELIGIIKEFKKYKKCIIIISHDKDVFPLFDEKINI